MQVSPVRTIASDDWRAAVILRGEFDLANAPELGRELNRHIDAGRRVIRIDARAVEFMDATALHELVAANARCRAEHGSLILTGVPRRMRRLVSLAGLDGVLLTDGAGDRDDN